MADAQVIARAQQAISLSPPAGPRRRVAPPRPAGKDAPAAVLQLVGQAARLRAIPRFADRPRMMAEYEHAPE